MFVLFSQAYKLFCRCVPFINSRICCYLLLLPHNTYSTIVFVSLHLLKLLELSPGVKPLQKVFELIYKNCSKANTFLEPCVRSCHLRQFETILLAHRRRRRQHSFFAGTHVDFQFSLLALRRNNTNDCAIGCEKM